MRKKQKLKLISKQTLDNVYKTYKEQLLIGRKRTREKERERERERGRYIYI